MCFLILLLVVFSGCVETPVDVSSTLYVDDDGGFDFTKIQDAIDAGSEGNTIIVRDGTYYEVLSINKSICLTGIDRETTIINNQNINQKVTVQINAGSCIFKGFTVIGPAVSTDVIGININSSDNSISNNIIMTTEKGIHLAEQTENNSISDTISTNNKYGISTRKSNNNNISNNEISFNDLYGIYFSVSDSNIISWNNISNNGKGVRIKGSDNSLVFDNIISDNTLGVWCCCGAGNNKIYHNTFRHNTENAQDDIHNHWDNGSIGNYWDDYIENNPDAAQINGIWDTPYNITGIHSDSSIYDRYPLVNPI